MRISFKGANDPHADARFDYMVGRLVEGSNMMARYVTIHGDDAAKGMAWGLFNVLMFFVENDDVRAQMPQMPTREDLSETPTEVRGK